MAQAKLFDRIGSYWDSRTANGRDGLILLDECIRRTASKDRDWDALARFVARANMSNNAAKVKKIIRAAFGNQIVFKLDKIPFEVVHNPTRFTHTACRVS